MDPPTTAQQQLTIDDLPNEVLMTLFSYLPYMDLAHTRMVSKRWLDLVNFPTFQGKTRFHITEENLHAIKTRLEEDEEAAEYLGYPAIELTELNFSENLQYVMSRLGKHIRSLKMEKVEVVENLHEYLPNLVQLSISTWPIAEDGRNLDAFNLNNFGKLKSFEYISGGLTPTHQFKEQLMEQLTYEMTQLKLEQLYLENTIGQEGLLLHAVRSHVKTLKKLHLNFSAPPVFALETWQELFKQLYHLEYIKISGNCPCDLLETIFTALPSEAQLKHLDMSGLVKFNDVVLEIIADKWPLTITHLELMFCVLVNDFGVRKLGQMRNNLRVLNLSFCHRVTRHGLLEGIAVKRNTVLRELYLKDMHELDEDAVSEMAEKLPYLTTFNLDSCCNAVTNASVQSILQYQLRLQHLLLDDCFRITDAGFLGYDKEAYSVRRLVGLQTLSVRSCRGLTNRVLIHGIHFKELRTLRLGYCHRISAVGIEKLVQHCPTLENLVISSCVMLNDNAVLHIARDLRRLRSLNVSNCFNLTPIAIDHLEGYCASLQHVTACGIDSFKVADVQRRLLEVKSFMREPHRWESTVHKMLGCVD